jgi:SAM-dependent methyltransferase
MNPSEEDVAAFITEFLEAEAANHRVERVLDAGAGRFLVFRLPDAARVTGLDVSEESLMDNPRLHARIVGDLETYPLPPDHFDSVACWNVLEHLERPLAALSNFHSTLRPGGTLILSIPNLEAPKTLVTKFTPHRFHIWIYRRALGQANAGLPGYPPFRTYLRLVLAPRRFRRNLQELGFQIEYVMRFATGMEGKIVARSLPLRIGWKTVGAFWAMFGRNPELSDIVWILRKPGDTPSPERRSQGT